MVEKRALARARSLRRTPAATERLLWTLLRDRRLGGLKFRRQVPLGRYVVDFLCLSNRLVIEADGPHHDPAYDAARDAWLSAEGFRVLRFPNADIQDRREETLNAILKAAGRS